ncbi:response regulator transcription factor [Oceanospirillum maris]|jgi:DNA-binding response OmpR family regulator|uniref:response regulator transcription factor n=1 Tax=Oceanospirillum maris TaxID=64977 RepID=UPI000426DFF9|nr:response regulator transcription factor [Oceanospirillum maris]
MTEKFRIIIVEDDMTLRSLLVEIFRLQGFDVDEAEGVDAFFSIWKERDYHLILLDLNLVDEDGLVLLRKIRLKSDVPLFVVSGRADRETRLAALEMGADDYIVKPFDTQELLIRTRNFLRRMNNKQEGLNQATNKNGWKLGSWLLSEKTCSLQSESGGEVYLTQSEYKVLLTLLRAQGAYVSKMMLMDAIDDGQFDSSPETIAVLIHRIRRKIGNKDIIHTMQKHGYRIRQ